MALFDFLRRTEERTEAQTEVTPPIDDVLLKALLSGETITREKALTLPAVSGCVDLISNCVACMPVKLFKERDGKVYEIKDDNRVRLLNGDTQDKLSAFQMKKAMVEDYLMGKGGYAYIKRYRNEVTGLYYVEDRYVEIMKTYEPIFKTYKILVMGKNYRDFEFIKLLRNTKDGASGVGLTVEVSKALETAYATLMYQLALVKSGGQKKGFLRSERTIGRAEIEALKTAWRNLYTNDEERVVVLNNGLQFQEASATSTEMQLNENKRTLDDQIYMLFHVYPSDFEATFKQSIYPIVKAFESALNRDLLLEKEKKNHFFELDVKEIVKASISERYQAYKVAKETGFLTINEIRRAENLNHIDGMDVINVGLGAVLYDTETEKYFTPNTGEVTDPKNPTVAEQPAESEEAVNTMLENHELAEEYDASGNSAERAWQAVADEVRYNDVHDAKTGRFGFKSGGGAWAQGIKNELDALPDNKKAMMLDRAGFLSREEAVKAWKNGTINDKVDEYIAVLSENGDYTPTGPTRDDNRNRAEEIWQKQGGSYDEIRKNLIKEDTGFADEEVEKTYQELNTWFSNQWDKADTKTLDKYVEASPTYDGKIYRGMHFETAEELNAFAGGLTTGDRITMRGKNSSWTTSEETARGYAHHGDDTYSSVVICCLKNKTASPVNELSMQGEAEVLASSKSQWTILRTESVTRSNGQKKMWVYVVEAETDGKS